MVGLRYFFQLNVAWGPMMAYATLITIPVLALFLSFQRAFIGSIAMWWVYFDTSTKDATEVIVESEDPGQLGAYFHYLHVVLVAGVIFAAVGNDLSIKHPAQSVDMADVMVIYGGPAIYLIGNAIYKRLIYGRFPVSHIAGVLALIIAAPFAFRTDLLMISGITTVIVAINAQLLRRTRL